MWPWVNTAVCSGWSVHPRTRSKLVRAHSSLPVSTSSNPSSVVKAAMFPKAAL